MGELPIQVAIRQNHLAIVCKIWGYPFTAVGKLQLVKAMEGFPFQSLQFSADLHFVFGKYNGSSDLDALKVLKIITLIIVNLLTIGDELF